MAVYPKARWAPCSPANFSTGRITNYKRAVVHVAQGSATSCINWFNNPKAQVSAHFLNPFVGPIVQFVDTAYTAWHCAQFNGESIGIEHEGMSGEHLNANQKANLRNLFIWLHKTHGIPMVYTADPNVSGVIGHGKLPEGALSHPNCPGFNILADTNVTVKRLGASLSALSQPVKPVAVPVAPKATTAPVTPTGGHPA